MRKIACALLVFAAVCVMCPGRSNAYWDLPSSQTPDQHGNILISRTTATGKTKPAIFSHWLHRQKFTCRVCHFELEFNMLANSTEITEAANQAGRYCGASGCHDGKASFGHDKASCEKCHNGNIGYGKEKFARMSGFPKARNGNEINWNAAVSEGMIKPKNSLTIAPPKDVAILPLMRLEAEWNNIPPAVFSHKKHMQWLDCNNCHPDIFNLKMKGTKHFAMERIMKREFCGVCHLTVAFPMNDCKRCHPSLKELVD